MSTFMACIKLLLTSFQLEDILRRTVAGLFSKLINISRPLTAISEWVAEVLYSFLL